MSFFCQQEWKLPWKLHYRLHPQAVLIRGKGRLWLQSQCFGAPSAGIQKKARINFPTKVTLWTDMLFKHVFKWVCLCFREGHLLPLIETLGPSWEWELCSGFQRSWLKISNKVGFLFKVNVLRKLTSKNKGVLTDSIVVSPDQARFSPTPLTQPACLASIGRSSHSALSLNWRMWLILSKAARNIYTFCYIC